MDSPLVEQIVGKLLYLTNTKSDIVYAMGVVNCFMTQPKVPHLEATKHILQYFQGTIDMGILFKKKGQTKVTCYIDVDLARDAENLRSTEGYVFQLGARKDNKLLFFRLPNLECRAFPKRPKESLWLKGLLLEFGVLEDLV
jgi:hypothetical protein